MIQAVYMALKIESLDPVSYTHLDVYKRQVQASDESRERAARDDQDSRSSLERAKNDKLGGWWKTQETGRKTEYFRSNESYKEAASEKTVATVTEEKTNKYKVNTVRRSYIREQTPASRDPVERLYAFLEKKETLNVPDKLQVPNRVVDEEGEEE